VPGTCPITNHSTITKTIRVLNSQFFPSFATCPFPIASEQAVANEGKCKYNFVAEIIQFNPTYE